YIDQTTTVHTYKTTTPINFNPKDFLLLIPPQTRSTLFPYTTLFRSNGDDIAGFQRVVRRQIAFLQDVPEIHVVAPRFLVRLPVKDRKSTRLNSSHVKISYAVFCLKKKKHIYNTVHNHRDNTNKNTKP